MLRTLLLFSLLLSLASARTPSTARPATGIVGADCVPGWEFVLRLADMPSGAKAYLIYYHTDYHPDTWKPPLHQELEFTGKVYITSEQHLNDPPRPAKITFDQFGAKEASGTYDVTLPDGSKQQGSFRVKRHRLGKHAVCM